MQIKIEKNYRYINFESAKPAMQITRLKQAFSDKVQKFPKDLNYIKLLAQRCGIPESQLYKLNSVIGPQQLEFILKNSSRKFYNPDDDFRLNLHTHTTYSDGKMTVERLLNSSADFANTKKELPNIPNFAIAVTDHDNLDAGKEALHHLASDPLKYQNLGVVLGAELSSLYRDYDAFNRPFSFEMVAYSLDPFDEKMGKFLKDVRSERVDVAKMLIDSAAKLYPQYNYTYDEACIGSKNPLKGIDGFLYNLAQYFSFKAGSDSDKEALQKLALECLPTIEGQKFNITNSIEDIFRLMRDKFGFLGVAHPAKIFLGDGLLRNDYIAKCKSEGKNAGLVVMDRFINFLTKQGEDKFRALETNYQAYKDDLRIANDMLDGTREFDKKYKGTINWLNNFRNLAEKYDLMEAGGLDTHGESPFIRH